MHRVFNPEVGLLGTTIHSDGTFPSAKPQPRPSCSVGSQPSFGLRLAAPSLTCHQGFASQSPPQDDEKVTERKWPNLYGSDARFRTWIRLDRRLEERCVLDHSRFALGLLAAFPSPELQQPPDDQQPQSAGCGAAAPYYCDSYLPTVITEEGEPCGIWPRRLGHHRPSDTWPRHTYWPPAA